MVRQAKGDGKAHTVQESIPFRNMFPDGLCRLEGGTFSKTIAFEDVNYRLASPEDQRDIFEHLCDFYNGYDPTIGVQVSLSSRYVEHGPEEDLFGIRPQGDDLDPVREDAAGILRFQYERGSNGYVKTKYVTLTIEAENLPAARARFGGAGALRPHRDRHPQPLQGHGGRRPCAGREGAAGAASRHPPPGRRPPSGGREVRFRLGLAGAQRPFGQGLHRPGRPAPSASARCTGR